MYSDKGADLLRSNGANNLRFCDGDIQITSL